MKLNIYRSALIGALAVGGFAAGFVLNSGFNARTSRRPVEQLAARPESRTELLEILALSSTCGASRYPNLSKALSQIQKVLREGAERENKRFVSVGLSLDQDPWVGIAFLRQFGPFDQVLSGGSWLNAGSVAFIVRDLPGERAIPQLILVERDVKVDDMSISTISDRLVGRKVGAHAIVSFAQVVGSVTELPPHPGMAKPGS